MNDRVTSGPLPLEAVRAMSGLELLRAMIEGRLPPPPMAVTLNFTLTRAEPGEVTFTGVPLATHLNPLGSVHGGWAAALLDSALGCAVHAALPAGTGYSTIEFKVNLARALSPGASGLECTARCVHLGRSTAISEGRLVDGEGRLVALGTATCAILAPRAGA